MRDSSSRIFSCQLWFLFLWRVRTRTGLIMRELDDAEVGLGEDCEEVLADVGNNADLYVANQESTDLISEAHIEDVVPLRFMRQDIHSLLSAS